MAWSTPTLRQVRIMIRDDIMAALSGAVLIGNSVMRVMSDAQAGLAHLVLRYIDWLARQFLPDTAETEWLDRHGDIWLVNADGSVGRKPATLATGIVILTGVAGTIVASGTQLEGVDVSYETTEQVTLGSDETHVAVRALDGGTAGNLEADETLSLIDETFGIDSLATVVVLEGGVDEESDALLRARVLFRIQRPPMGGDADDYVAWTLAVPGVTRAWASPLEMGMGTVTVRFMMDALRVADGGFPNASDIADVKAYLDIKRPVAVKDFFVEAPLPEPISFTISNLDLDGASTRAAIEVSVRAMLHERGAPGYARNGVPQEAQVIYAAWVSEAILNSAGVNYFDLIMEDHLMPSPGHMAVLGSVAYA